ncbi:hypothetical protein T310_9057, partial [Rasamsonia emersonii CBS 393.64]
GLPRPTLRWRCLHRSQARFDGTPGMVRTCSLDRTGDRRCLQPDQTYAGGLGKAPPRRGRRGHRTMACVGTHRRRRREMAPIRASILRPAPATRRWRCRLRVLGRHRKRHDIVMSGIAASCPFAFCPRWTR